MRTRPVAGAVSAPTFEDLENLVQQVQKRYGAPLMSRASAAPGYRHIETGIFTLDFGLLGGLAEGFATMLYGWKSAGKTTLAMRAAATAQRKHPDMAVVFIDAEGTYDPVWAKTHGVDNERLYLVQPESGEMAVDVAQAVMKTASTTLMIVDSLPALVPQKEADMSAEDSNYALRAKLIALLCSKTISAWHEMRVHGHLCSVIFINQWREKIGGAGPRDNKKLPGGQQPTFLCSTMIESKNHEILEKDERGIEIPVRNEHSFKIDKSKVGNSMRRGDYILIRDPAHRLGAGAIDEAETVLTFAKKMGFYGGGGTSWWITTTGDKKFKKSADAADYLDDNPDEMRRLKQFLIMKQRKSMGVPFVPADNWLLGDVPRDLISLAQAT